MTGLTKVYLEKEAKHLLKLWCREHKARIAHYFSCSLWTYGEVPFWALVVRLWGFESPFAGIYGFHIYEDSRVQLIGRLPEQTEVRDENTGI